MQFYDVGQGDAILIEKGDTQILVDGDPNRDILNHLGRDLLPWDREIELLVLTHPHADHLTGLLSVLERYQIKRILYYPSVYETQGYEQFRKMSATEGARILHAVAGGQIRVGELILHIIWPTANFQAKNINNESVVLLLDYLDFEVLLLGDAEADVQRQLPINYDIEVLKIAHHGSWDGTYEPLLRTANPDIAIISSGKDNRYGHPHAQALSLLAELEMPVLRTDIDGTVSVRSNGRDFWYTTAR
ncbi:MBL fold metallo-hydrolase [Candidatus Saccharibacteria bacterium]|nr:MBL fold metallo-hydrolase [Candidatus Saccharibacteria bacterium]